MNLPACYYELLHRDSPNDINSIFDACYNHNKTTFFNLILFIRNQYDGFNNQKIFKYFLDYLYNINYLEYTKMLKSIPNLVSWKDFIDEYSDKDYDTRVFILNRIHFQLLEDKANQNKSSRKISLCAKWIPNENSARDKLCCGIFTELAKKMQISRKELRSEYIVPLRKKTNCVNSFLNDVEPEIKIKNISNYNIRLFNNFLFTSCGKDYINKHKKLINCDDESDNMKLYYLCNKLLAHIKQETKPKNTKLFTKIKIAIDDFKKKYMNICDIPKNNYMIVRTNSDIVDEIFVLINIILNLYLNSGDNLYLLPTENSDIPVKLREFIGNTAEITLDNYDKLAEVWNNIKYGNELKTNMLKLVYGGESRQNFRWVAYKGKLRWSMERYNNYISGFNQYAAGLVAVMGRFDERLFMENILKSEKYSD
jgi:hypothetical protein